MVQLLANAVQLLHAPLDHYRPGAVDLDQVGFLRVGCGHHQLQVGRVEPGAGVGGAQRLPKHWINVLGCGLFRHHSSMRLLWTEAQIPAQRFEGLWINPAGRRSGCRILWCGRLRKWDEYCPGEDYTAQSAEICVYS
ncbi:MAG: hypothetical protein KGJ55_06685 [Gammaproteobacteria bacterium]|nr:hypothetical protein [Gammaproteobacteria bacterium]